MTRDKKVAALPAAKQEPFVLVMGEGGLTRRLVYAYDARSAVAKFIHQVEHGSGGVIEDPARRMPRKVTLAPGDVVARPATEEDLLEFKQKRRKHKKLDQLKWDI